MTVLHSGSNNRYSSNWESAFGKPKKKGATAKSKGPSKKKAAKKKKSKG